jgi:uncharacterized membrane protein YccC
MQRPSWLKRLRGRLIESDPGLLRFQQALKSVLAVAISLAAFRRASNVESLFAAISAAFLMQCVDSGSRTRQQGSMAATACGIMIMAPLGSALHGNRGAEAALLVGWAAAVFYARRFLKGNGGFTLFAFTEVLLATALPGNPRAQFLTAAVGFAIAYVLRFWVWPSSERRALRDAVHIFFRRAALMMEAPGDPASGEHLSRLRAAAGFTQQLLDEHPELDDGGLHSRTVQLEYQAVQSLRMLREANLRRSAQDGDGACAEVHSSIRNLALCRLAQIRQSLGTYPALPEGVQ